MRILQDRSAERRRTSIPRALVASACIGLGSGSIRRAFTLVEILVGLVVVALIASATLAAMSGLSQARRRAGARHEAVSAADAAATRLALDVQAIVRDWDLKFCRIAVTDGFEAGRDRDQLLVLTRSMSPQRPLQETPEGGEYEVQARLEPAGDSGLWLWRRRDAAFDPYQDSGGVAAPIARCVALSVEAFDGEVWFDRWDSDADGLPHAIRIKVTGASADGRVEWTARRVAAIDRVPIPVPVEASEDQSAAGGSGGGR
jgi:prepilin-type N-terminal cleavage/methylation domain-containing protein